MQGRDENDFESLYLTLPSNGGGPQYATTNTNTHFKVKLPYRLQLPGKGWQVALSSIAMPRPTRKIEMHKASIYDKIPKGRGILRMEVDLCSSAGHFDSHSTDWIKIEDVLEHSSVVDGASFMKRLTLLGQQSIFELFREYPNLHVLRPGSPTGERGYPLLTWDPQQSTLLVDWTGTARGNNRLALWIGREMAELMGAVQFINGDVTNEWHYGPNLIIEPWFTNSWNDGKRAHQAALPPRLLKGPIFYASSASRHGFFAFLNVVNYRFFNVNQWFDPFTNAQHGHTTDSESLVLVYSNVGRGAIQGDQITDLLREIPLPVEDKIGHIYYEPKNLHHVDVRQNELDVVEIVLGKPEGGQISLASGLTQVKLHFRRIP